jgi:hypothetical protein
MKEKSASKWQRPEIFKAGKKTNLPDLPHKAIFSPA